MTTPKSVIRNTFAVLASHGLAHVLRLGSTVLLLAALSRRDYGILTFAVAFVDPVRAMAAFGLDTAALRRAGREPDRLPEILGTLLHLRVRLAAFAFLLCIPLSLFRAGSPGGTLVVIAAALSIVPAGITGPLTIAFQARHRMHRIILLPAVASAVHVAVVLGLWALRAPLPAFVAAAAFGEAAAAIAVAKALKREIQAPLTRDPALTRALLREGAPLAAVNLAVVIYGRLGVFLLEAWHGPGPVADYGAARRLVEPIVLAGSALAVSANPFLSRLAGEGRPAEIRRFLVRGLSISFAILVPAAAVAGLAAPALALALKADYLSAVPAFRWLLGAGIAMFACQVLSAGLVAVGRFRTLAALAFLNLGVFTALAVVLIPSGGATGAAQATTGMETLNLILQVTLIGFVLAAIGRRDRSSPGKR